MFTRFVLAAVLVFTSFYPSESRAQQTKTTVSKAQSVYHEGLNLFARGRYAEAKDKLVLALILDRTLPGGWVRLGYCYEVLGDKQRANWAYKKGLEINPQDPEILRQLRTPAPEPEQAKSNVLLSGSEMGRVAGLRDAGEVKVGGKAAVGCLATGGGLALGGIFGGLLIIGETLNAAFGGEEPDSGIMILGVALPFIGGALGALIAVGTSGSKEPTRSLVLADQEYRSSYISTFKRETKRRKKQAALLGSLSALILPVGLLLVGLAKS